MTDHSPIKTRFTRRSLLATSLVGAFSGCLSRGHSGRFGSASGPPIRSNDVPLEYALIDVFDHSIVGDGHDRIDDPPAVGRSDPAINEPVFVEPNEVRDFLDPGSIVFGLEKNGEARAYPQLILVWHEFVNDTIGGDPVSITYCPLTGSALAFDRGETGFGLSGKLANSNVVMYDFATKTWWPQILGVGIAGPHMGDGLFEARLTWTTWERWQTAYPETVVLSRDTGYIRDYGDDPYGAYNPRRGYYASGPPATQVMHTDDRLEPKTIVMGTRSAGGPAAVTKDALRYDKIITVDTAWTSYTFVYDEPLDSGWAYQNPTGEDFSWENGHARGPDNERWSVDDLPLEPVNTFDVFWFAWAAFYPNTTLKETA